MKLLKVLTIVLFSLLLVVSVSFSQESTSSQNGAGGIDSASSAVTEKEKSVTKESNPEQNTTVIDPVIKKATTDSVNKKNARKNEDKKSPEKKVTAEPSEIVVENTATVKLDGDLLPINEGNFKYKRIPDIKLTEIVPQTVVINPAVEVTSGTDQNSDTGFMGLSKTTSDVIVKVGVLLLILIIFILYKSRMTGPRNKSSKKRNVLNSYRK